jgi:hypothetical protein
MSVLDVPRYSFTGVFYCNPSTANNDDVLPDVVVRDTLTLGSSVRDRGDDDQIRTYLFEAHQRNDPGEEACKLFLNAGWNPFGNHWCNFLGATIRSGVVGAGDDVADVPADDPILGMPVKFLGSKSEHGIPAGDPVMVDMDATGLVTTQIFVGGLQIGDPAKGGVVIHADATAYQSWLNFNATVSLTPYGGEQNFVSIGCMMQLVFPAAAIPAPTPEMPRSLQDLLLRARAAAGLVVRFQMHEVEPGYDDTFLAERVSRGIRFANAAYGYGLGTIGVHYPSEPVSEPEGRKLTATYPRAAASWQPPGGGQGRTVDGADRPWRGPPALVGNAVCVVKPGLITVDLSSAVPKLGFRNPKGPVRNKPPEGFDTPYVMADIGELELCLRVPGAERPVVIGPIDYGLSDPVAFRDRGGIALVRYDPRFYEEVLRGTLFVQGRPGGTRPNAGVVLLGEAPRRVIVEPRAEYVGVPGDDLRVGLRLRERGQPTSAPTTLFLKEYTNIIQTDFEAECDEDARPNQTTLARSEAILGHLPKIELRAGEGWHEPAGITVRALRPGVSMLAFQLQDEVIGSSVPAWSTYDYTTLRVFTDDDYSDVIASGAIKWEFVYSEVLRFYYVLFPAMTQYVKLDQRCAVFAARRSIREILRSPYEREAYRRTWTMPVTRSMSPGKVKLLLAWLAQEENDPTSPCRGH